jgi:hypothetical protein
MTSLGDDDPQNLVTDDPQKSNFALILNSLAARIDVVKIEIERRARAVEAEDLRRPDVELVGPVRVHRAGRDQVHGDIGCAAR